MAKELYWINWDDCEWVECDCGAHSSAIPVEATDRICETHMAMAFFDNEDCWWTDNNGGCVIVEVVRVEE
jgi:hypothetical protein